MKKVMMICLVGVSFFLLSLNCYAEESKTFLGIGMIFGGQFKVDPMWHVTPHDYNEFQVNPIVGEHLSDRWEIWLEGKIDYLNWKTDGRGALKLGASILTSYDILKFSERCRLYAEAGVGIGYRSWSPSNRTLGTSVLGLIDYGVGAKYKIDKKYTAKIGVRFEHTSSIPASDTGINTYGIAFALLW